MPETIRNKRTPRKTRKAIAGRSDKKKPGRPGFNRKAENSPQVIGNSLSTLILQPIPGVIAAGKIGGKHWGDEDYTKMYHDLIGAYYRYCYLANTESTKFNPLASGMDMGKSMFVITERMKKLLPEGFKMNIDKDDEGYYFTFFKEVDFSEYWHFFAIESIVKWLEKKDKNLLEDFMHVIAALSKRCDFPTWYNGNLYAYDMVLVDDYTGLDFIYCRAESDEEREEMLDKYKHIRQRYFKGDIHQYEQWIKNLKGDPEFIKKRLANYKKRRNPIVKWMFQALDLINERQCLENFIYNPGYDEYESDGCLRLRDQITILWSDNDIVFDVTSEYMDNEAANFGIEYPMINIPIGKNSRFVITDQIPIAEKWMGKIDELFQSYKDALKYVKHEFKN